LAKTFVKDIEEGAEVNGVFLVDSAHRRFTKAKKAYLKLVLADKSGQIESVMWDETMEKNPDAYDLRSGDFIDISGRAGVNRFTGKVEVILNLARKIGHEDLDITDFLPRTDRDMDELKKELAEVMAEVDDPYIEKLLDKVFKDPELSKAFYLAPAAKNYHHAYLGGLLEHSVSVAQLAVLLCRHYDGIDKSLLIAGALLHDIGKIREFDYTTNIDYSTEGRLKGHIVIGGEIVGKLMDGIRDFPEDLKLHLSHLVLSHQGELEYGAAVRPKTKEAVILNVIDNADAKVNGWMSIAKKYGDDVEWTDFQSMFGDYLYMGTVKREEGEPPAKPTLF
jgi:3'-5' exoribonuclease